MLKLRFIFVIPVILLFTQCKIAQPIALENVVIQLEKTYCSGPCPVYTLQINTMGEAIFEGVANVKKIGRYKSTLSNEQYNDLLKTFDEINFFSLNDSYTSFMMDLPTNYVSFSKNGQTKQIKAYDNVPKPLMGLINKIDLLVSQLTWTPMR